METHLYYDERPAEMPSGIFDLRQWPLPFQRSLVKRANQQTGLLGLEPLVLDPHGYAWCREPAGGANPRWMQGVFALQRQMEVAVGGRVLMPVKIERVYRVDFPHFTPIHWAELAELFGNLPESLGTTPYPRWFGERGGPPPYLWASIERGGLRVRGILNEARWAGWDTWLRRNLDTYPLLG